MSRASKFLEFGRKIVGIGRNYADHAKELGNEVPKEPMIFLKPTSSFLRPGGVIEVPSPCSFLDHEVELAVVIGRTGRNISREASPDYVEGYALALDMTARELQAVAKAKGLPWSVAKGYDTFTPIGDFLSKEKVPHPESLELWLKVDGELRQRGKTSDMIFDIPRLIRHVSTIMTLEEGDLILTGTPAGVGPVRPGQTITAGITGLTEFSFPVIRR